MAERVPGWYRDPNDPSRVLHWGGRGWSGPHRSLPAWALSDTDVAVDCAWGSLRPAAGGPVLEGPVRPTPLPAATRGSLAGRRGGVRTQRLVRPAAPVGGPPGGATMRVASSMQPAPGWVPARRPLMVFCALVGVAVLMMAATVVGVNRVGNVSSATIGRDAGFVARAASVCQAGLDVMRTEAAAAPGDTGVLASDAERSSAAVGAVEQQLRAIPVGAAAAAAGAPTDATTGARTPANGTPAAGAPTDATAANGTPAAGDASATGATTAATAAVGAWLDDLHNYMVDEEQLAITLRVASTHRAAEGGRTQSPAAGVLQAQTIAMRVSMDQRQADAFANANGLGACDLAPPASSSPLVAVP